LEIPVSPVSAVTICPHFFGYFTLWLQIVDEIEHPEGDEDDIVVVVILDSTLRRGRIEFRNHMSKQEMDLVLLSAFGEICDLRGKLRSGECPANEGVTGGEQVVGGGGGGGSSGSSSAHQAAGYFKVASAAVSLRR